MECPQFWIARVCAGAPDAGESQAAVHTNAGVPCSPYCPCVRPSRRYSSSDSACLARYASMAMLSSSKRRFLSLSLRRKAVSSTLRELPRTLCAVVATSELCLWSSASSGSTTCAERGASSKPRLEFKAGVLGSVRKTRRRANSGADGGTRPWHGQNDHTQERH